jgi:hypothetical protein
MIPEWRDERVEAFRARLDRISADIKALEQYLANSCVFVEVTFPLGDSFPGEDIVWKRCEPDRWRLVYRKRKDDERPLMESKVEVRIAAARVLPGLLARVGDVIGAINEHAAARPSKESP